MIRFCFLFIILFIFKIYAQTIETGTNVSRWYKESYGNPSEYQLTQTTITYIDDGSRYYQMSNNTELKLYDKDQFLISLFDSEEGIYLVKNSNINKFYKLGDSEIKEFTELNNLLLKSKELLHIRDQKISNIQINKTKDYKLLKVDFHKYEVVYFDYYKMLINKSILFVMDDDFNVLKELKLDSTGELWTSPNHNNVIIDHFPRFNYFFKKDVYSGPQDIIDDGKFFEIINLNNWEEKRIFKENIYSDILNSYSPNSIEERLENTKYRWIDEYLLEIEYERQSDSIKIIYDISKSSNESIDKIVRPNNKLSVNLNKSWFKWLDNRKIRDVKGYIRLIKYIYDNEDKDSLKQIRPGSLDTLYTNLNRGLDLSFTSTSFLKEGNIKYDTNSLKSINSLPWVEGVNGPGIGEKIVIESDKPIKYLLVSNGYYDPKKLDLFKKNNRLKEVVIRYGDRVVNVILRDTFNIQEIPILDSGITKISLEIKDIYKGSMWDDTCITYIGAFN